MTRGEWKLVERALELLRLYAQRRVRDYDGMRKPHGLGDDIALAEQALRLVRRHLVVIRQQLGWRLLRQLALRDHYDEVLHGGGNGATPG